MEQSALRGRHCLHLPYTSLLYTGQLDNEHGAIGFSYLPWPAKLMHIELAPLFSSRDIELQFNEFGDPDWGG